MRKTLILALSLAGAMIGTVPLVQAQPYGQARHADRDRDDRHDRHQAQPRQLSREQSLRMRNLIVTVGNEVEVARRSRRIDGEEARGLRARVRTIQQAYDVRARGGLDIGEYDRLNARIVSVRNDLRHAAADQRGGRR